jgi:hypothetical protein
MAKYNVTYLVNLIHEIEIEADTPEQAEIEFERMYTEEQNLMPEYHDISHEVYEIEEVTE